MNDYQDFCQNGYPLICSGALCQSLTVLVDFWIGFHTCEEYKMLEYDLVFAAQNNKILNSLKDLLFLLDLFCHAANSDNAA